MLGIVHHHCLSSTQNLYISSFGRSTTTYDHRLRKTGHPVRSALHKPQICTLVGSSVTRTEYACYCMFSVLFCSCLPDRNYFRLENQFRPRHFAPPSVNKYHNAQLHIFNHSVTTASVASKMPPSSPLTIATRSLVRLTREERSYHKEMAEQQAAISRIPEDENAQFTERQQVYFRIPS